MKVMRTCIATCVKNEGRYLIEWIAWNRMIGFDEIAIYDNGSFDDTFDILEPLAKNGIVTLHGAPDLPGVPPQIAAYNCELKRPTHSDWVMFSDPDEFLIFRDGRTIGQFLGDIPEDVAQVCFNWRLFGSSGLVDYSAEPVASRFTMAANEDHFVNRHVKAITRRTHIAKPTIHAPVINAGKCIHADEEPAILENFGLAARATYEKAWINHYVVKSRAEFDAKIARGRGAVAKDKPEQIRPEPEKFWAGHNTNHTECLIAKSRVPELLREMAKISF